MDFPFACSPDPYFATALMNMRLKLKFLFLS